MSCVYGLGYRRDTTILWEKNIDGMKNRVAETYRVDGKTKTKCVRIGKRKV